MADEALTKKKAPPMPLPTSVGARDKLKERREPYWHRMEAGNYLGFRKMTKGAAGTWLARSRDPSTGAQSHHALGEFEDLAPSERFDAAKRAAEQWFKHLQRGGTTKATTVEQACKAYVSHLRGAGRETAARDAEKRFERWVNGTKFGRTELQRLKPSDVATWRAGLAQTPAIHQDKTKETGRARSPSSLNRDMTTLRAALNLALEDGAVTSDTAWKVKLRPVKDADGRRDVYLDPAQRRALLAKAEAEPDFAALLRALSLVPLRPGAMAALTAGDFDKRLSTLRIGRDKAGKDRKIALPPATAAFFAEQAKDKLPAAPLLARAGGRAWDKDAWKYPMKAAVLAAELTPAATVYALRHSVITDLLALHKLDTLTVAQLSGTSLQMIEKHYGHLLRDHAARALAALTV